MQIQQNIFTKINSKPLIVEIQKILFFVILASVVPAVFHTQWITGPIVNAILFLSVIYCGLSGALVVSIIPSVVALSVGLLPAPLAPAIPYIILGNAIMVLVFSVFRNKNFWLGIGLAALLKFAFLFGAASIVIKLLSASKIAPKIIAMLSWPQLATALAGGIIAFGIYKCLVFLRAPK
ncbi:MAG: iron hydrogenase [bacterium]